MVQAHGVPREVHMNYTGAAFLEINTFSRSLSEDEETHMPGTEEVIGSAAGLSVAFGMLPDWRVPAGKKICMKEAVEQVVELFRAPAKNPQ